MASVVRYSFVKGLRYSVVKPGLFHYPRGLCSTTIALSLIPYDLKRRSNEGVFRHFSSSSANYGSGPNNRTSILLLGAGVVALVGGSLAFRVYVNREPDYDNLVKEAKKTLASSSTTAPPSVSEGDEICSSDTPSVQLPSGSSTEIHFTDAFQDIGDSDSLSTDGSPVPSDEDETVKASGETDDLPSLQYIDSKLTGFPDKVRYLIIGAGSAGLSAARSIRAADPQSRVLMIAGGTENSEYAEPGIPETSFAEPPPYLRPPLSKELWRRTKERESRLLQPTGDIRRHSWLYYEAESFYIEPEMLNTIQYGGVSLLRGDPVVRLDPDKHVAVLASGRQITYERCLLATGGKPKRLHYLERCARTGENLVQTGHVSYFRTLGDYRRLRDVCDGLKKSNGTVAIIGGGFLGSELAVSLLNKPNQPQTEVSETSTVDPHSERTSRLKVMHVFRESAPLGQILPPCLAAATGRYETTCGAELWPSSELVSVCVVPTTSTPTLLPESSASNPTFNPLQTVTASHTFPKRIRLRIRRNGPGQQTVEEVDVDHVVCVVGIEPNVDLAASAGLEVDPVHGGFLVNAELETRAGVYAAGDAASYWDPVLGFRRRVEHLNFAEETGQLAGKNMAAPFQPPDASSTTQRYHYQSSLWSTLGPNLSWDAVGNVDARNLETKSFFFSESDTENTDASGPPVTTGTLHSIPDADLGRLGRGVVFYLTPKEKRLVGLLLWNLPDELYTDEKYAAPSRLNMARSLLAQRLLVGQNPNFDSEEAELCSLASQFDLSGELARDYAELKAYMESQAKDQTEVESTNEDDKRAEQSDA